LHYWEYREQLPEEFNTRPLQEIIPVTTALSQGYDIDKSIWEKLHRATNQSEVSSIVREDIKKKPARKGSLIGYVYLDGSVKSLRNGVYSEVGFLDVNNDDADVKSLIERIINRGGLIRRE
jgi:hypothetical protein